MYEAETIETMWIYGTTYVKRRKLSGSYTKMIAEFFLGSARLGSDIFRLRLNKNPARLGSTVLRLSFCGSSFGLQVYPLAFDAPVKAVPVGILPSRLVWEN